MIDGFLIHLHSVLWTAFLIVYNQVAPSAATLLRFALHSLSMFFPGSFLFVQLIFRLSSFRFIEKLKPKRTAAHRIVSLKHSLAHMHKHIYDDRHNYINHKSKREFSLNKKNRKIRAEKSCA